MTSNPEPSSVMKTRVLAKRIRVYLQEIAAFAKPITYKVLAAELELMPPKTIHQVTDALECLMKEDAHAGHPFIAAFVISRARNELPAPGFFELAQQLGRFNGDAVAMDIERKKIYVLSVTVSSGILYHLLQYYRPTPTI